MKKRMLSLLLAIVMLLSMVPTVALAEDEAQPAPVEAVAEAAAAPEAPAAAEAAEAAAPAVSAAAVQSLSSVAAVLQSDAPDGAVAKVEDSSHEPVTTGTAGNLGDGYYASLKSAVAAGVGVEGGTTVTLVSDTAISNGNEVTVVNGQTVTIDLDGHYVYSNFSGARGSAVITVQGTGVLTIKDSADIEDDSIANGSAGYITTSAKNPDTSRIPGYANNTITCYGTLNLESGFIENNSSSGGATFAIDSMNSGTRVFNITGGKVTTAAASAIRLWTSGGNGCTCNISNAYISSLWVQDSELDKNGQCKGSLNIENCVFTYGIQIGSGYDEGVYKCKGTDFKVTITDTEFGGKIQYLEELEKEGNSFEVSGIKAKSFEIDSRNFTSETAAPRAKVLSDGYFMEYVAEGCIADDYYCIPNPDDDVKNAEGKKYTYKIADYYEEVPFVAEIYDADGNFVKGYDDFDNALSGVKTGETIKMLKNAAVTRNPYLGYGNGYSAALNFTVDLCGHVLDVCKNGFNTNNNSFSGLTFTSTGRKGTLNLNDGGAINTYYSKNDSVLTFENVNVATKANNAISIGWASGVKGSSGYKLVLNNANITGTDGQYMIAACNDIKLITVEGSQNSISSTYAYGMALAANNNIDIINEGELTIDTPYVGVYSMTNGDIKIQNAGNINVNASEYGIFAANGDVELTNSGDAKIKGGYGVYSVGSVNISGSGNATISGSTGSAITASYDVFINNTGSGVYNITSTSKNGIYSNAKATVVGTGETNITGKTYGIFVYDAQGSSEEEDDEYGLKVTNPKATISCTGDVNAGSSAVYVGAYVESGTAYGDNTAVIIEDGTFNGTVYFKPYYGTTDSVISGGTFNGAVNVENLAEAGVLISDGVFKDDVSITNYYGLSKAKISGGTFDDQVILTDDSDRYDYSPAHGANLSIEGGKFGSNVKATYYNWDEYDYYYAKCISGGIFACGDTWTWDVTGAEYATDWPECIAPGYAKGLNSDKITKVPYPYAVVPLEIKVNPDSIAAAEKKDTEGNELSGEAATKANATITEMMNNTAVGLFVETGIEEATNTKTVTSESFNISMVLDAVKEAAKNPEKNLAQQGDTAVDETAKASANGQITISEGNFTDENIDKKINVDLEASKIEVTTTADQQTVTQTTVNGATFDVKPTATITITDGTTGTVISTVTAVIPNEAITRPITFRLPIDEQITTDSTAIWHCKVNDAGQPIDKDGNVITDGNYKQEYLGIFPILTDPVTGEKYVELSAREFSYYTYENLTSLSTANVVAILSSAGYTGFDTLAEAIAAFNAGTDEDENTVDNAQAIILLDDIVAGTVYEADGDPETEGDQPVAEPASFDFDGKTLELDLNGHKFVADPAATTGVTNATGVTVINSDTNNQVTLAATGIYANNVKAFVVDGYDTRTTLKNAEGGDFEPAVVVGTTLNEVFNNTESSVFEIEVITSTTTDHDSTNDGTELHTGNRVDVYADETVTVQVVVNGARFTAADVTLTWDDTMFTDTTNGRGLLDGWNKGEGSNANTYRFTSPKGSDSYYEPGTVLGTFTFKANYLDEEAIADTLKNPATFTVKNDAHPAKVIGGWGVTLEDSTTEPVPYEKLKDDFAKILLMSTMVGAVEGKTGLIYKGSDIQQNLLNTSYNDNKGWSAKVAGNEVTGAQIQYCVLTKADVDAGVTPGSVGHAYSEWTTGNTVPKEIDADTYTVYYRIKANGYETVEGSREVTIAKQPVTLTWTAPTGFAGSYTLFVGNYNASGFSAPTAKYSNLDGSETTLTANEIKLTSGSEGMKDVGSYEFTAVEPKNYSFTNPTANVKVNGLDITGWQLTATNAAEATPTVGVIFRDGESYPIGKLNIAEGASIKVDTTKTSGYSDASDNEVTNVKIVYEYFVGKYYKAGDEIPEGKEVGDEIWTVTEDPTVSPKYSNLGEYKLRMTVTADNYEKLEQEVTFTIKNPIFKYETTEYVAGYTLILVYTNESGVTFKYGTEQMYDETIFGYRWHNTESYSKVYGIVIEGNADESKILASNAEAQSLGLPAGYDNTQDASVCDVNNKTTAQVSLDDMTAVQSIYNVNAGNMLDMQLVLRSDVNRDKKVDTIGDVSKVMSYYLTLPQGN